ncbi:hypothetical protein MESS4_640143 [Mesorhizobium sp. STM 4661]|nr:hypothetical protein MESS4_640143 [Mesorhizobium sp. STM 4661]
MQQSRIMLATVARCSFGRRNAVEPHIAAIGGRLEPELFIDRVGVVGRQAPVRDRLAVRMIDKRLDKPRADPSPAMLGPDDDVGKIGKHRAVGDRAAEADLFAADVSAGAERIGKGAAVRFVAAPAAPVACHQQVGGRPEVDPRQVEADLAVRHGHYLFV